MNSGNTVGRHIGKRGVCAGCGGEIDEATGLMMDEERGYCRHCLSRRFAVFARLKRRTLPLAAPWPARRPPTFEPAAEWGLQQAV